MAEFKPLNVNSLPKMSKRDRSDHYLRNGIDVIDFAELQFSSEEIKGFFRINILKYVTRFDRKGGLDDLKKAEHYLQMLKELVKKER